MSPDKPSKPYPSFPLTAHPNGQWCKKILGKVHFFGVWADPAVAHDRYLAQAADLHAGRQPRCSNLSTTGLTVKDVLNAFLNWQKEKLQTGEIGVRWLDDCTTILRGFANSVGKHRLVDDLRPEDFQRYRLNLAKRLGVHALTRHISAIRTAFKYACDIDLLDRPIKFGTGFSRPSATLKRRARIKAEQENGKRLFSPSEIRRCLDTCPWYMSAPILLGINGGFGNTDCSSLPASAIDLDKAVIEYARPKTGVQRIVPLWPETVKALDVALNKKRPSVLEEHASKLALLTPTGLPFVRQVIETEEPEGPHTVRNLDRLSHEFIDLLTTLECHRRGIGFYALRHTFRTWADETKDQHAIHRIMGHAIPGMSGIYIEDISMERLRAVVDHVRSKLWPSQ